MYFYKTKKTTTSSPGAWIIGGGLRETGEEKVGDASPKRVGSERNKRNLRSIDNYFAMKKPRKQSREPGLQCTGGGRLAPLVLSPSPASLILTVQTVYNILTDCLRLFS